ncbi:hypothetical protein A6J63_024235 [Yersinia enterocolitica]|nr:hypothetical protein A6J63_024235 [Yersinia enterocolitica]
MLLIVVTFENNVDKFDQWPCLVYNQRPSHSWHQLSCKERGRHHRACLFQFAVVLYKAASIEVKFRTILRRLAIGQQQTDFY